MPFYPRLKVRPEDKPEEKEWKKRTARRLLELRSALRDHIFAYRNSNAVPTHDKDDKKWMRIATWNIREFGAKGRGQAGMQLR